MPLVKSSEDIKNDRCTRCNVSFIEHPGIKTVVYNNFRRCASYAACKARQRGLAPQQGNRNRFGTTVEGKNPCEIVITGRKSGYRKGQPSINVRCYCMAKFGVRKDTQFKYDILGSAHTIEEAKAIWQAHVRGLTSIALDDTFDAKEDSE